MSVFLLADPKEFAFKCWAFLILEVDGVVKTIFLSFLNAVPGEERLAEG
jgi:hypothetical protein